MLKGLRVQERNVEIYKRMIEAFNEKGFDAVLDFFDEGIEVYDPDLPDGPVRGHERVRAVMNRMLSAFERMTVLDYRLIAVGDRVVCLTHLVGEGTGHRGAMKIEIRDGHVMTFREGKIVYWRLYLDAAEALADVGLDADGRPLR